MSDELEGEVTVWIQDLKAGNSAAAQQLFQAYFDRIVRLASRKLDGVPKRVSDEEDVALSAFESFFRGVDGGKFPKLDDSTDLWRLLATITTRKAVDQVHFQNRQKRGGGKVRGESVFANAGPDGEAFGFEQFASADRTPEMEEAMTAECQRLFEKLGDEELVSLALLKLEGYSNVEIAVKKGVARRTIQRKLAQIQELWSEEID